MHKLVIKKLNIVSYRALKNINLTFNDQFNLIEGANGLGKSSILDAIRYVFFNKNSDNKRSDNYRNAFDESYPYIVLEFTFNGETHILTVKDNNWYIDDSKFARNEDYTRSLARTLKLDDIDELFVRCNPHLLVNIVSSKSENKKILKDEFVKIINLGLDENSKLHDFENLVNQKNDVNEQIKLQKANIKNEESSLNWFKNSHSEIQNWDIDNNVNVHDLSSIQKAIDDYRKISNDIEIKRDLLRQNNNKLDDLNSQKSDNVNNETKPEKTPIFKLILLTILTLGLYLIIYFKNRKNKPDTTNNLQSEIEYKIKTLIDENKTLQEEIQSLENNPSYKDVNYELLLNKKSELQAENDNNTNLNSYKLNYHDKLKKIEKEKEKLQQLEDMYTNLDAQYKKSLKAIENIVDNNFKDFKVALFDQKGSDNFNITQNGIELKNLNFANKNNIIHSINQFIKKGIEIDCFNLIDQAESFNKLNIMNENTQTIACKVTEDSKLKLNGKYIN